MRLWVLLLFSSLFPAFPAFAAAVTEAGATVAKQAFMVEDATGSVLLAKEENAPMHPSSMSKLMTLYMLFEALKEGHVKLTDSFPVSATAWRMQGSKMFVELGARIPVEDLIRGIAIQSGNDACVVVAEGIAGSEATFAGRMNEKAKQIGLTNSHFVNATGWPDDNHLMTARDLATLAHRLIHDFPEYYHYFSETEFTWHGIVQGNRNTLFESGIGADGLKTGHTEQAGYGIVASAKQGGRRLVLVVNGLTSMAERAKEAERLLRAGFRDYALVTLFDAGSEVETLPVFLGISENVKLVAREPVQISLPRSDIKSVSATFRSHVPVVAPVAKGQPLGELVVTVPGESTPRTFPLIAGEEVEKMGPFHRIFPALSLILSGRQG